MLSLLAPTALKSILSEFIQTFVEGHTCGKCGVGRWDDSYVNSTPRLIWGLLQRLQALP